MISARCACSEIVEKSVGEPITVANEHDMTPGCGSVGEPITSKRSATVGHDALSSTRKTETGGVMITTIPGAVDMKPGSAALPFFGIEPRVIGADGNDTKPARAGSSRLSQDRGPA